MKRTFVGSTIYHIYLSVLHLVRNSGYPEKKPGENILFLVESTPMIEKLIPSLKQVFFRNVYLISERKDHVEALGKFNYTFKRKETLIPYLEHIHPELKKEKAFINESDLYLCDSDSSKSYFLYEFGNKHIYMIEDGARTYRRRHTSWEYFLKKQFIKTPVGGGFDPEIGTLLAQHPDRLPLELRSKAVELNIRKEVAKLDQVTREEIFKIFMNPEYVQLDDEQYALILTQPISEDGVVKNENEKINIYKNILTKIPSHLKVVLKTHPRESTRYQDHFKDIIVLPALFPIEILELREDFYFEQGYTLFSTALSNLDIVNERFFMGKDYLDKFTSRSTRDLIKNMVTTP